MSTKPTTTPSISLKPSTIGFQFDVPYMYMVGFDNPKDRDEVLDGNRKDMMDAISQLIVTILQDGLANTSTRYLRHSGALKTGHHHRTLQLSLKNINKIEADHQSQVESTCTADFSNSTDCILLITQITLNSNNEFDVDEVESAVVQPLKASMEHSSFRDRLAFDEVREVKHVEPERGVAGSSSTAVGVGGGLTAIISISSVLLSLFLCFFVRRRIRRLNDRERSATDEGLQNNVDSENYLNENENDVEDQLSIEEEPVNVDVDDDPDISIDPRGHNSRSIMLTGNNTLYNLEDDAIPQSGNLDEINLQDGISVNTSQAGDLSYDGSMRGLSIQNQGDAESSPPDQENNNDGQPITIENKSLLPLQNTAADDQVPANTSVENERVSVFDLLGSKSVGT